MLERFVAVLIVPLLAHVATLHRLYAFLPRRHRAWHFLHQGTPPSARYDFRMMAVNSSLYLFGGYGATGVRRSEIWFLSLSELWRGDARPLRCAQNLLHLSDFVRNGEWRGMCAFTRGNAILRLHACEYDLYLQWIPPLQQAHMSSAKRRLHCCRNDSDACHVVCLDC